MDPFGIISRHVFVPIYERRHGHNNGPLRRHLLETQFLSADEIRALQWEKIQTLVRHAYEQNAFYRRRFDEAGLAPDDVDSWEAFGKIPLLTKDDLRDHLDEMISRGYARMELKHKRTGGSTGVPVHLYWDEPAKTFKQALSWRHDTWAGYRLGVKRAALWGDTEKAYPWNVRLYNLLAYRTFNLDTLLMDERRIDIFLDRIRRSRPDVLLGHGHSLFFFAKNLRDRGIDDISFCSIISTAESLSPDERRMVEDVFGPIVFDRYGCEEVSIIASECEAHAGLHVAAEGLHVEVLDETDAEPGRVVLTDLTNRAMPFLRYEVGDLATTRTGRCACGRGLPRLGRVMGRTSDILYAPDGRSISGISILDTFMIHIPGIKQAQIIQEKLDELRILAVKDRTFSAETLKKMGVVIEEIFGPAMRWRLEEVAAIPRTPRGKFQFTICKVGPEKDGVPSEG